MTDQPRTSPRSGRPPGVRTGEDGMTDRQRAVVECIRASVQRRGYPSSMREIGQAVGLSSTSYVPLVGRIAAGGPILAEQTVEDVFPLPRQLVGEGELFALTVRGNFDDRGRDLRR